MIKKSGEKEKKKEEKVEEEGKGGRRRRGMGKNSNVSLRQLGDATALK